MNRPRHTGNTCGKMTSPDNPIDACACDWHPALLILVSSGTLLYSDRKEPEFTVDNCRSLFYETPLAVQAGQAVMSLFNHMSRRRAFAGFSILKSEITMIECLIIY